MSTPGRGWRYRAPKSLEQRVSGIEGRPRCPVWFRLLACSPEGQARLDPAPAVDPPAQDETLTAPEDGGTPPEEEDPEILPVVFIHGIDGSAENWAEVLAHLEDDGWPVDRLYAHTFDDPSWGCNIDNAATI